MRPLIDFVHVDDLPWEDHAVHGGNSPGRRKVLSVDDETGEVTALVQLPRGWRRTEDGYCDHDEELFTLSGLLEADGTDIGPYSYSFHPAGKLRPKVRAPDGTTFLSFSAPEASFIPADEHGPLYRAERAVGPVSVANVEWEPTRTEGFPAGAARKTLRVDEVSGEGFWILAVLPHWSSPFREMHTFAEENYILEGEVETTEGVMTPGAYLHHPPGYWHGPMRSRPGMMTFTRALGPFGNRYERVEGYAWPAEH